jgi:broad specificity phosphatase PhoE
MLVLIRHGESTANASGLLLGRSDVELTEHGREQVLALRPLLAGVGAVISSPLRRALDTAALLDVGVPHTVDRRWIEVDYGEHEGKPLGDIPAEIWQRWRADPAYRPAGGESLAEVRARVGEACAELFAHDGQGARAREADVVVVSHVSPIKAAVAWALGVDQGLDWRLQLSTASLTRIGWGAEGPAVHTFNAVPSI